MGRLIKGHADAGTRISEPEIWRYPSEALGRVPALLFLSSFAASPRHYRLSTPSRAAVHPLLPPAFLVPPPHPSSSSRPAGADARRLRAVLPRVAAGMRLGTRPVSECGWSPGGGCRVSECGGGGSYTLQLSDALLHMQAMPHPPPASPA